MYTQVDFSLSESQIDKLQRAKREGESATLELSKDQVGGEHTLYLTNRQVTKLDRAPRAIRITFSKTQMKAQKGGFLGAILGLAKTFLPKVLPVLGTLGLSAASGAISGATHQATGGRGLKRAGGKIPLHFGKSDISNILGIVSELEGQGLLPANTCEECMQSIQKQEGGFIGTLIASLAGSLLPALLGGKGLRRAGSKKS